VVAATVICLILGGATAWALSAPRPARGDAEPTYLLAQVEPSPVAGGAKEVEKSSLRKRRQTKSSAEEDRRRRPEPALLAAIPHSIPITAKPGGRKVIGRMPAGSRFFDVPLKAWIMERSNNRRFGKVTIPYSGSRATGWIRLRGLDLGRTRYSVSVDLSRRVLTVKRLNKVVMRFPAATGAPSSPSPVGRYFVTDRVSADPGGPFGSFAFGLSGIQPNLPPGWTGGDQMAIHGTNDPSSIGRPVTAGCPRVSERALDRLKPVMRLGTPVEIKP
jgi:lipoprotein-anchoring transpeptidase ErfK/SrfK